MLVRGLGAPRSARRVYDAARESRRFEVAFRAFRAFDVNTVEVKRMYVKKEHRGTKIASSILNSLEDWASEKGFIKCILETGNNQVAAINFYKKSGYKSIPNYGQYAQMDDSNCFEKLI